VVVDIVGNNQIYFSFINMNNIFPIDNNFCKIFKEKNNPEYNFIKLPNYLNNISNLSITFATKNYFKHRLCLLNDKTDHLIFFNYPNNVVIDDYSLLFLLKLYRLYELMKLKIVKFNSEKNKVVIYNDKMVNFDKLCKYIFILKILENNNSSLNLTSEDINILSCIIEAKILDFFDKNNLDNIFNSYLRISIVNDEFYRKFSEQKIKQKDIEKYVEKEFEKMKKNDKNFVSNLHKQFIMQYDIITKKLENYFKTSEYEKFQKSLVIKPFKYPMKEIFGKEKPLQYQMFKNLVDEFEKEVKLKLKN